MKTFTLALLAFTLTALPAFAHTGVAAQEGGIGHDLLHMVMNHDGTMAVALALTTLVSGIVLLGIGLIRRLLNS